MNSLVVSQVAKLGELFGMKGDGTELLNVLKSTAFRGQVTDAQMSALMVVSNQYKLNPFTREIYAFPDRQNGIVPVVGVDGWSRIINENPQFDGIDFQQDDESCTCIIYRKDRAHPIKVTEWMEECKRDNAGPWKSHPRRMLRHKALIQCARLAFGFVGIYDQDEAERLTEIQSQDKPKTATEYAEAARPSTVDSVERDALILELESIAEKNGDEALKRVWGSLTKEQRATIGKAELDRIKQIATSVTVDVETGEVSA